MSTEPLSIANSGRPRGPGFRSALDRFFEISLYLLVVTGFFTLASTGRLDALSLAGVSTALLVRGYLLFRDRRFLIPERWTSYLTLTYVLFYAVDFFLLSQSFVSATVHLVLFGMVVKVFSVQRERDHVYLAILSFLEVLAAAVLTVDTMFLGAFCVFLLLAAATFISMEMRRSAAASGEEVPAPHIPRPRQRLARALSITAAIMVITIVLGGGAIFFILPRLSAGYLSAYAPQNDFVSGFTDSVQLGQIGRIKQSDRVIMHVEVQNGPTALADLKWRGISLALFDGRTWSNPAAPIETRGPASGSGTYRFELLRSQMRAGNAAPDFNDLKRFARPLFYRVTMEPIGNNVIFVAGVPAWVEGRMREIGVDVNGSVFNLDRSRMTESYNASSLLAAPPADRLRGRGPFPPDLSINYLQLPKLDRRIPALAEQITAQAATPYDKAVALELYLRTRYGYSLQMAATPPKDPLAYFLFERKEGHCEYFASAMAVMLRSVGIPARIVNGFRGGEYNDITGSYIVRARDAHSWVEAYVPGYAWVSFDPTPADPRLAVGGLHRFSLYLDALSEFWREWVINYDFLHQQNLTFAAMLRGRSLGDRTRLWLRVQYFRLLFRAQRVYALGAGGRRSWLPGGFAVLVCALALPGLLKLARERRLAHNPQRAPQAAASLWYARLCRRLARRGLRKYPGQTPGEFVLTIENLRLREQVGRFTEHYERARFGHSPDDARRLPALYEEITRR